TADENAPGKQERGVPCRGGGFRVSDRRRRALCFRTEGRSWRGWPGSLTIGGSAPDPNCSRHSIGPGHNSLEVPALMHDGEIFLCEHPLSRITREDRLSRSAADLARSKTRDGQACFGAFFQHIQEAFESVDR